MVGEQVVQCTQDCTKRHYTFPCHANKSFNLKRRQFSCLAPTLQLPLFRQNSVSGQTGSSLLLVGSAAGQTPVQPVLCCSSFPCRKQTQCSTHHRQEQIKLHFLFIEAHCVMIRASIESCQYAFYSLSVFTFLNSFYSPSSQHY